MTTKTNADRIADAEARRGAELLAECDEEDRRSKEILRLDTRRDGYIDHIYNLGEDSYVVELSGGHLAEQYGNTYRVIVRGAESESRIYVTLDHAILAVIAHRNGDARDAYAASTFAARALGVDTGIE